MAAVILLPAVAVVTSRNIIHAAFWLVPVFLGVAGEFLLLHAEFLAAIQVLIYAGAITVLLLFALMLTRGVAEGHVRQTNELVAGAILGVGFFTAIIVMVITGQRWATTALTPAADGTAALGTSLLTTYLLPFEVASVLLLAAMIGAIVLSRKETDE
jgi:NADH-quinone oxidoreductase subunit J